MIKVICFGAAGGGKRLFDEISKKYEIVAFTDNDSRKWGNRLNGLPIIKPEECISSLYYDYVVITSAPGLFTIQKQLLDMGVPDNKILSYFVEQPLESRRIFLKSLADMWGKKEEYAACAEAGVFEGDFAQYINAYFKERTLYLFDTFEGFDERDLMKEDNFSEARTGDYNNTSIELVMQKMQYPNKVKIRKGYFPESAKGIDDKFCFVNLDLDLYEPTYQGLLYFETKMVKGGVILVHDYFAENFKGVKEAVDRFIRENDMGLNVYPIGDGISVMITGF